MADPKNKVNTKIDFTDIIDIGKKVGSPLDPLELASVLEKEKIKRGEGTNFVLNDESLSKYNEEEKVAIKELYKNTQITHNAYKQAEAFPAYKPKFGKNAVMQLYYSNINYSKGADYNKPDLEFSWNGSMIPIRNMTTQELADTAPFLLDTKNNQIISMDKNKLEEMTDDWSFSNIGQNIVKTLKDPIKAFGAAVGYDRDINEDFLQNLGFSGNARLAITNYGDIAKLDTEEGRLAKQMIAMGTVSEKTNYKKKDEDGNDRYMWKTLTDDQDSFQEDIRSVWGPKAMYNNNIAMETVESLNDFALDSLGAANFIFNYAPKKVFGVGSKYLFDGEYDKQVEKEYNNYNAWAEGRKSAGSEEEDLGWNHNFTNFTKGLVNGVAQVASSLAMGGVGKAAVWGLTKAGATKLGASALTRMGLAESTKAASKAAVVGGTENALFKLSPRVAEALITAPATGFGYTYAASSANKEARASGINPEAALAMAGIAALAVRGSEKLTGGNWVNKLLGKETAEKYGVEVTKRLTNEIKRANRLQYNSEITETVLNNSASKGAVKKVLGEAYEYISKDATNPFEGAIQGFVKEGTQEVIEDSVNKTAQAGFNTIGDMTKAVGLDWIGDKERYHIETDNLFKDLAGSFIIGGAVGGMTGSVTYSKEMDNNVERSRTNEIVAARLQGADVSNKLLSSLDDMKEKGLFGSSSLSSENEKVGKKWSAKIFDKFKARKDNNGNPVELDDNEFRHKIYKQEVEETFAQVDAVVAEIEKVHGKDFDKTTEEFAELVSSILGMSENTPVNEEVLRGLDIIPEYNTQTATIRDKEGNLKAMSQEDYDELTKDKSLEEINNNFQTLTPVERAKEEVKLLRQSLKQSVASEAVFVKKQLDTAEANMAHLLYTSNTSNKEGLGSVNPNNLIVANGNLKGIKKDINTDDNMDTQEVYADIGIKNQYMKANELLTKLKEDTEVAEKFDNLSKINKELRELDFNLERALPEERAAIELAIENKEAEVEATEKEIDTYFKDNKYTSAAKAKDLRTLMQSRRMYEQHLDTGIQKRFEYFKEKAAINVAATYKLGALLTRAKESGINKSILSPYTKAEKEKRKKYYINKVKNQEKAAKKFNDDQKAQSTAFKKMIEDNNNQFNDTIADSMLEYYEKNPGVPVTQELKDLIETLNVNDSNLVKNDIFKRFSFILNNIHEDSNLNLENIDGSKTKVSLADTIKESKTNYDLVIKALKSKVNENSNPVLDNKLKNLIEEVENEINDVPGGRYIDNIVDEIVGVLVDDYGLETSSQLNGINKNSEGLEWFPNTFKQGAEQYKVSDEIDEDTGEVDNPFYFIMAAISIHHDNVKLKDAINDFKDVSSPYNVALNLENKLKNIKKLKNNPIPSDNTVITNDENLSKEFYLNDNTKLKDNRNISIPAQIEEDIEKELKGDIEEIDVIKLVNNINKSYEPLVSILLDQYVGEVENKPIEKEVFNSENQTDLLLRDYFTKGLSDTQKAEMRALMLDYIKSFDGGNFNVNDLSAFSRLALSHIVGTNLSERVGFKLKSRLVQDTEYRGKYLNHYLDMLKSLNVAAAFNDDDLNNLIKDLEDSILELETKHKFKLTDDFPTDLNTSLEIDQTINDLLLNLKNIEVKISEKISSKKFNINPIIDTIFSKYDTDVITALYKSENTELNNPLMPTDTKSTEHLEATINYLNILRSNELQDYYNALYDTALMSDYETEFTSTFEQQQVSKDLHSMFSGGNFKSDKSRDFWDAISKRIHTELKKDLNKRQGFYNKGFLAANVLQALHNVKLVRGYAGTGKTTFIVKELIKLISNHKKYDSYTSKKPMKILVTAPASNQLNTIDIEMKNLLKEAGLDNVEITVVPFDDVFNEKVSSKYLKEKYDTIIMDEATLVEYTTVYNSKIKILNKFKEFGKPVILAGDEIQKSEGGWGSNPWTRSIQGYGIFIPRTVPLVNPMRTGKIDSFNLQKNIISSIVELSKINKMYLPAGVDFKPSNKALIKEFGNQTTKVNSSNFVETALKILKGSLFNPISSRYTVKDNLIDKGVKIHEPGLSNAVIAEFKTHRETKPNDDTYLIVVGDETLKNQIIKDNDLQSLKDNIIIAKEAQGQSIDNVFVYNTPVLPIDAETLLTTIKDLFVAVSREKKTLTISMPRIDGIDDNLIKGLNSMRVNDESLINQFVSPMVENDKGEMEINDDLKNRQGSTFDLLKSYSNNNVEENEDTEEDTDNDEDNEDDNDDEGNQPGGGSGGPQQGSGTGTGGKSAEDLRKEKEAKERAEKQRKKEEEARKSKEQQEKDKREKEAREEAERKAEEERKKNAKTNGKGNYVDTASWVEVGGNPFSEDLDYSVNYDKLFKGETNKEKQINVLKEKIESIKLFNSTTVLSTIDPTNMNLAVIKVTDMGDVDTNTIKILNDKIISIQKEIDKEKAELRRKQEEELIADTGKTTYTNLQEFNKSVKNLYKKLMTAVAEETNIDNLTDVLSDANTHIKSAISLLNPLRFTSVKSFNKEVLTKEQSELIDNSDTIPKSVQDSIDNYIKLGLGFTPLQMKAYIKFILPSYQEDIETLKAAYDGAMIYLSNDSLSEQDEKEIEANEIVPPSLELGKAKTIRGIVKKLNEYRNDLIRIYNNYTDTEAFQEVMKEFDSMFSTLKSDVNLLMSVEVMNNIIKGKYTLSELTDKLKTNLNKSLSKDKISNLKSSIDSIVNIVKQETSKKINKSKSTQLSLSTSPVEIEGYEGLLSTLIAANVFGDTLQDNKDVIDNIKLFGELVLGTKNVTYETKSMSEPVKLEFEENKKKELTLKIIISDGVLNDKKAIHTYIASLLSNNLFLGIVKGDKLRRYIYDDTSHSKSIFDAKNNEISAIYDILANALEGTENGNSLLNTAMSAVSLTLETDEDVIAFKAKFNEVFTPERIKTIVDNKSTGDKIGVGSLKVNTAIYDILKAVALDPRIADIFKNIRPSGKSTYVLLVEKTFERIRNNSDTITDNIMSKIQQPVIKVAQQSVGNKNLKVTSLEKEKGKNMVEGEVNIENISDLSIKEDELLSFIDEVNNKLTNNNELEEIELFSNCLKN